MFEDMREFALLGQHFHQGKAVQTLRLCVRYFGPEHYSCFSPCLRFPISLPLFSLPDKLYAILSDTLHPPLLPPSRSLVPDVSCTDAWASLTLPGTSMPPATCLPDALHLCPSESEVHAQTLQVQSEVCLSSRFNNLIPTDVLESPELHLYPCSV